MSHIICICGKSLSTVSFPNHLEGELKGIFEYKHRNVWECEECGRLWIDVDDPEVKGCHIKKSYIPEDEQIGHLFGIGTGEECVEYHRKLWLYKKEIFEKIQEYDKENENLK